MLIDSGADATLLPRSIIATLGIEGTGERYPLVAFDGWGQPITKAMLASILRPLLNGATLHS